VGIPNATDTHSEYVLIIACPLQQWFQERASTLGHAHSACHFADAVHFTPRAGIASLTQYVESATGSPYSDISPNSKARYVSPSDCKKILQFFKLHV
jgi:hypothetical protein